MQVGFVEPKDALDFRFQIRSVNKHGVELLAEKIAKFAYTQVRPARD